MFIDGFVRQIPDTDQVETSEWLDSLQAVIDISGKARARYLIARMMERAREQGVGVPAMVSTPYINTIAPEQEPWFPGDEDMERRIRSIIRWNAAVMVARANRRFDGLGGHLATYASAASLYEVGFNHFFRGKDDGGAGDQVFMQGHAAPGIYSRAFLEGRISEDQLDRFRREVEGGGLPSYPHPRHMPGFWEFPTVSMGLGLINAVYQARFNRYLLHNEMADTSRSRVWCFAGDGEMDEPESLAGLSIAAREQLDNLVFVVNCNLQRLDGPVRGNGKIIQELEALFRGAGWHVIKVVWGREWDELLARDVDGVLLNQMNTTVDGQFQKFAVESGAYIRERFFGPDPRLAKMVEHLSDDDLRHLRRGGHDYRKVYAAYKAAVEHQGSPTVILAQTIKGWALGPDFEARNATHQLKKMSEAELKTFRDRLYLDIPDSVLEGDALPPYHHPGPDSPEVQYLQERRRALDGYLPHRVVRARPVEGPAEDVFADLFAGTGEKIQASTTTAFARLLRKFLADPGIGRRVVPIIPDEARTFGLDALFREYKIYAPGGQLYEPVDADLLLSYQEGKFGRILEEGITEAGSMSSFTAAGTAYATWGVPIIPFFIYYSMFGFQRVGDLIWSFGDQRGRGFMLGATAGRTTLTGEGLQHTDGNSQVLALPVPNCRAYDPAFAYEMGVIVRDGIERMFGPDPEDVFYYLTLYNENYSMPAKPEGVDDGILRGLYRYAGAPEVGKGKGKNGNHRARILGSGPLLRMALGARELLADQFGVAAEVWSATSYKLLAEEALSTERWNRLHPTEPARVPYVTEQLDAGEGPVVAVTDFIKGLAEQIGRFVPAPFVPLGTDGFGWSDTRDALRRHFEVDAEHIAVAVLASMARSGDLKSEVVADAIRRFDIDPEASDPRYT